MAARAKIDPDGIVRAALMDAWNAGLEIEAYREFAASAKQAQEYLLEGDCRSALTELVVAFDQLDFNMTTLG